MSGRNARGASKEADLRGLGVHLLADDRPRQAISFFASARDYLSAGAFLMDSVHEGRLRLGSHDAIDQSLAHAAELALKAHLWVSDPEFVPHEAKHGILGLFDQIARSEEATPAGRRMHDVLHREGIVVSDAADDPEADHSNRPPELADSETPVDVRRLFEWYGGHLEYLGSLYRYPRSRLATGISPAWKRTEDGGHSRILVERYAFRYWIDAYLRALYAPVFAMTPCEEVDPE